MQDSDTELKPHEIAEFVMPIAATFKKSFDMHECGLNSLDLTNICASTVMSIIASCMPGEQPLADPRFKRVVQQVIRVLIESDEGRLAPDYMARVS